MHLHQLYVLRHGETEWNRAGRWQGRWDSPLTDTGRTQAREMGAILRRAGVGPASHRLISSPQGRCRATAALVAAALDWPGAAETDARLREIDVGEWSGRAVAEVAAEIGLTDVPPFPALYAVAPGGEALDAVAARVGTFLADLDGPAVVVTHGITSRFLRALALGRGAAAAADLPGGAQGAVFRLARGEQTRLTRA
ncbi:histidine phosphatase family protein [Rhodobacteraceae bacterium CCMM004]|nr:histidine phosphatase family protein [Rhodobacteraceae bacterium CCMM004]